jgi:hypothetical protein
MAAVGADFSHRLPERLLAAPSGIGQEEMTRPDGPAINGRRWNYCD